MIDGFLKNVSIKGVALVVILSSLPFLLTNCPWDPRCDNNKSNSPWDPR